MDMNSFVVGILSFREALGGGKVNPTGRGRRRFTVFLLMLILLITHPHLQI
jgi:hypothetical protein